MRKFTATLFLLATLSLGCLAVGAAPAVADESLKTVDVVTEYGPYSYNLYEYPSYNNGFLFYKNSYVEFDSVQGKFWRIDAPRFNVHIQSAPPVDVLLGTARTYDTVDDFKVIFYAPDGTVLFTQDNARPDTPYSFPVTGEKYDKVRVRIECRAVQNVDAKFIVWEPVNPVVAEPLCKSKKKK